VKIALKEMRRRPREFVVATAILTLIALLLMFLGSLLDGLLASSTGAYRAQQADLVVYSSNAKQSLVRSRIDPATAAAVASTPGVTAVGGLAALQLGARPSETPETRDLVPVALMGYELAPRGLPADPPAPGTVIADSSLRSRGVAAGDTLLLGPQRSPVVIDGFVDDTRYAGQGSLWGSLETWRVVAAANRPGASDGRSVQALVVQTDASDPEAVAAAIDAETGQTDTLTVPEAIEALPGIAQQRSTFNQIIGVTVFVALVVVALFFALITVERTALYGVLKAIGGSGSTLFSGLVAQALVVTAVAAAVGIIGSLVLATVLPPGSIPFATSAQRLVLSAVLIGIAAVAGCALSLRRILRIDPASAMGASA